MGNWVLVLVVRVFARKGVSNLGIGKVDLIWTPGQRPADFGNVPDESGAVFESFCSKV